MPTTPSLSHLIAHLSRQAGVLQGPDGGLDAVVNTVAETLRDAGEDLQRALKRRGWRKVDVDWPSLSGLDVRGDEVKGSMSMWLEADDYSTVQVGRGEHMLEQPTSMQGQIDISMDEGGDLFALVSVEGVETHKRFRQGDAADIVDLWLGLYDAKGERLLDDSGVLTASSRRIATQFLVRRAAQNQR